MAMYWLHELLLLVLVSSLILAELEDMPPAIVSISFGAGNPSDANFLKELTKPQDFVVRGSNSNSRFAKHELRCEASNADTIYWEYKTLEDDPWSKTLPTPIQPSQPVPPNGGELISLTIDDGDTSSLPELNKLNGFYRCTAENAKREYKVQAAPVRIVLPYIAINPSLEPKLVPGSPEVNQPFSIPCFHDVDKQLFPRDAAKFTDITFNWELSVGGNTEVYPDDVATDPTRIKVDPVTGTLYFAYLISGDKLEITMNNQEIRLNCLAKVDSQARSIVGTYQKLIPAASSQPLPEVDVLYPPYETLNNVKVSKDPIVCTSGEKCKVIVIFSGRDAKDGKVRGMQPEEPGVPFPEQEYSGFEFTAPVSKDIVKYEVQLYNPVDTGEVYEKFYVKIQTKNYPKLSDRTQFPPVQYVESGKEVEFRCEAEHVGKDDTKFFINGNQVQPNDPPYVTAAGQNTFTVGSTNREDSFAVQCESKNKAGTLYTTSVLNVYDPPVHSWYPTQDYVVQKNNKTADTLFMFNCSVVLDTKAAIAGDRPEIYWRSNNEQIKDQKITTENDYGVKSVFTKAYDKNTGSIESTLTLELDTETLSYLQNTRWWCQVEYTILDDPTVLTVKGESAAITFEDPVTQPYVAPPWPYYPVLFGAIGGLIFLILLVVLINCYVQKNKGEQYYVEDKEIRAGHNPKEEMEAYGFSDYTRPDQNPVKGSRASMNMSDRPMESDTGSLDEYGADMDPSRYNEDGSFIDEYGRNGPQSSRHQADV